MNHRLKTARNLWALAVFWYRIFIAPWPPFTVFMAVTAVVASVIPSMLVFATSGLIDAVTERARTGNFEGESFIGLIVQFLPWMVLMLFVRAVEELSKLDPMHRFMGKQLGLRSMRRLEGLLYGKAVATRLEWFEHPRYYDSLQRAVEVMDEQWQSWALLQMQSIVITAAASFGALVALAGVHWSVPLLMLLASGVLLVSHGIQTKRSVDVDYSQTSARRRKEYWEKLLTERPSAAEVRLFDLASHIVASWRKTTFGMLKEKFALRRRNLSIGIPSSLASVALFSIVLVSLVLVANAGGVTAGAIVAYLYITQWYISRISETHWRARQLHDFVAKMQYMPQFLELEQADRRGGAQAPSGLQHGVRFEGVDFTFPGSSTPTLKAIDLELRAGETVALVGENGAGKTTLTKLLLGLYEPTAGSIKVDGTDMRDLEQTSWRGRVGAVFQDYMAYAFTARENVGFGRVERIHDLRAIESAALKSGANSVVGGLKSGWETVLGREFEGGHDLSRGQWQTLAIARLYMRDAELLVLDEPTSALDPLAEVEVYRQFLELSLDKTVLLISHRLGSARLANRVVFLKEGQIVEEGTHDELVAVGGTYAELFEMQAEWYR